MEILSLDSIIAHRNPLKNQWRAWPGRIFLGYREDYRYHINALFFAYFWFNLDTENVMTVVVSATILYTTSTERFHTCLASFSPSLTLQTG